MATASSPTPRDILYSSIDAGYRVIGLRPNPDVRSTAGRLAGTGFSVHVPGCSHAMFGLEALAVLKEFQAALKTIWHDKQSTVEFHRWLQGWAESLENRKVCPKFEAEVAAVILR